MKQELDYFHSHIVEVKLKMNDRGLRAENIISVTNGLHDPYVYVWFRRPIKTAKRQPTKPMAERVRHKLTKS